MATVTASRPVHVSTPVLVALAAAIGILAGALVGYAIASPPPAASDAATTAQVAADNALVDRWVQAQLTGTREEVEAMLLPTFRMSSTNPEMTVRNPAGMWSLILDGRRFSLTQERTTDVMRVGDVIFWGGAMKDPSPSASPQEYTWTVRVTPEGRFANAWLGFH